MAPCSEATTPARVVPTPRPAGTGGTGAEARARALLATLGEPPPEERYALGEEPSTRAADALATQLMDRFRRTGASEVFECLVTLVRPALEQRVRSRLRWASGGIDPDEVVQDALVNVFRYPDRFVATRPGAFRAWSTMIVDNSVRRRLRGGRGGPEILLQSNETLALEADTSEPPPLEQAARNESSRETQRVFSMLLCCYLAAFEGLNERERFVLQMVEVHGMRYAELARELDVRPEALKMVVFRARRRIQDRLTVLFSRAGVNNAVSLRAAG